MHKDISINYNKLLHVSLITQGATFREAGTNYYASESTVFGPGYSRSRTSPGFFGARGNGGAKKSNNLVLFSIEK